MGSIVIHDGMDRFTGRDGAFDFVEEADEFLMSVALHIIPQDCSVEHINGGKQCRHRCGARPWARQIWWTVDAATPSTLAIARSVQWVTSFGGGARVNSMIRLTTTASIGTVPGGASCRAKDLPHPPA